VLSINVANLSAGVFLTGEDIAYLAVSAKIATSIALILTAVNTVVAPKFSHLYRSGDVSELENVFKEARNVSLLIGILPFLLIFVFAEQILWIFGDEFVNAKLVLLVIASGQFINAATGPVTYLLQMTGNEREFMKLTALVTAATVAATFVLTAVFGVLGAASAVAASAVALNLSSLALVRRRLGFSWI
jgi:O-antigen/teichoic acid export membrane protein